MSSRHVSEPTLGSSGRRQIREVHRLVPLLTVVGTLWSSSGAAAPPAAPTVPEALKGAVAGARKSLTKVMEHCLWSRTRNGEWWQDDEEADNKECLRWRQKLLASNVAGVHAIGQVALSPTFSSDDWGAAMGEWPGLVEHLGKVREPDAVGYLVRAAYVFGRRWEDDSDDADLMRTIVDALRAATGTDVATMPPWEIDDDTVTGVDTRMAAIGRAWADWYAAHRGETPEEWAAQGLTASHRELSSTDPLVRFRAIARQLGTGGDERAALESLEEALSDPTVSAGFVDAASGLVSAGLVPVSTVERAAEARDRAATLVDGTTLRPKAPPTRAHVKRLLRKCTKAFDTLRLADAFRDCSAAAAEEPNNAGALIGRGWVELERGDTKTARASATAALALKPGSVSGAQLMAAVLTVERDAAGARAILETAAKTSVDARQRLSILRGEPPAAIWVRHIAPRHACWQRLGKSAADAFLLRRGIGDPESFATAWGALSKSERRRLERNGLNGCPWPARAKDSSAHDGGTPP